MFIYVVYFEHNHKACQIFRIEDHAIRYVRSFNKSHVSYRVNWIAINVDEDLVQIL